MNKVDFRLIESLTPKEFLIAHRAKLKEAQRDAHSMIAKAFHVKYGLAPKEYQKRLKRLRELAAQDAAADPDNRTTMRMFTIAMMWRERDAPIANNYSASIDSYATLASAGMVSAATRYTAALRSLPPKPK